MFYGKKHNGWQRFRFAFGQAWVFATQRGGIARMTRQQERAFQRRLETEWQKVA